MPDGVALSPVFLHFLGIPYLGPAGFQIEALRLPKGDELDNWRFLLRGLDIEALQKAEFWLTHPFEYEERSNTGHPDPSRISDKANRAMSQITFAAIGLHKNSALVHRT